MAERPAAVPGALFGCAGLYPTSTTAEYEPAIRGMLEPLVALAPDRWGLGYARESVRAIVRHAFDVLRVPTLAAVTDFPNERSDRMLRSVGLVLTSEMEGPRYPMRV